MRAHCIKKARDRESTRRRERGDEKKGSERKRYERTRPLSPSLSSSPSFGHSTTYAEVGRRTREREREKKKYKERKKASYDPNYCRLERQQQQLQCAKKQC